MILNIWKDILTLLGFIGIVLLLYGIIILSIRRYDKKTPGTSTTLNGLKILLRFLVIFIIVLAFLFNFNISSTFLISLSSISGIIIGFAATEVIGQMVAGLYLITVQPFDIDDMVKIGSVEGVVEEINLHHTIIKQFNGTYVKIPNKKLLDTKFKNYSLDIEDLIMLHQGIKLGTDETKSFEDIIVSTKKIKRKKGKFSFSKQAFTKFLGDLSDFIHEKKVTQYTFTFQIDLKLNPQETIKKLMNICEEYEILYLYKPKFAIVNLGWRAEIKFWIFCTNPYIIMENQNHLITSIANTLYSENPKGGQI